MNLQHLSLIALLVAPLNASAALVIAPPSADTLLTGDVANRISVPLYVDISSATHGDWSSDGRRWQFDVSSPNATSLQLSFNNLLLPDGAELSLGAGDVVQHRWNAKQLAQLTWLPRVQGDTATLVLTSEKANAASIEIAQINYGYKSEQGLFKAGSCHVNTSCSQADTWRDEVHSVARYDFVSAANGGGFICSGVLLNNTSGNGDPLFLTADHCINKASEARSMVLYWKFETANCGDADRDPSNQTEAVQMGASLVANWGPTDFSLVRLNEKPNDADAKNNVHYAGWDRRDVAPEGAVALHHPSGDPMKISIENDPLEVTAYGADRAVLTGQYLRVADWDIGSTESGSSGSGLWSNQHRVVGQLSGGLAACGNDQPDWYGRLHSSWFGGGTSTTRLSTWLDPNTTGAECLNGGNRGALAAHIVGTNCSSTSNEAGGDGGSGGGGASSSILLLLMAMLGLRARRRG